MKSYQKLGASLCLVLILLGFQNCSQTTFNPASSGSNSSQSIQGMSGSVTVGSTGTNPTLDLFFIVDNSASMFENQVRLASSFNSIFQTNSTTISNFNVNVYLFSTASTVNTASLAQVATRSPASVTSVPAYTDIASLLTVPGNVIGYWNNTSGTYGTAPFSEQFNPAPVLAATSGAISLNQALYIAQKGTQTDAQYQAAINTLSQNFQARLAYLNPDNQFQSSSPTAISAVTDVSSGLCSISRILKHSGNFIQAGDAAAFIIVSDDNDRLNVRNPASNACAESIVASKELINGSCGHYQTNFTYDTTSTLTYQSSTNFTYPSGSNVSYSYPSGQSCGIQYNNGYTYSWTYTQLNTNITYTKCNLMADGFCVSPAPNTTVTVSGNQMDTSGNCLSSVSSLVASPAPGTTYTCAANNTTNVAGTGGVDANSNGTTCSTQLLGTLSNAARSDIQCKILAVSTTTKTIAGALNSCPNFCTTNASTYPGCKLMTSTTTSTSKTIAIPGTVGLTCNSQCPSGSSSICGTGTIASYITANAPAGATCGSNSNILSTLTVNTGVDSSNNQLSCTGTLPNTAVVKNSSGTAVCSGQTSLSNCIQTLQPGESSACTVSAKQTSTTVASDPSVTCSTACSASHGLCTGTGTVAAYLAQNKLGYCQSNSVGGAQTLNLVFKPSVAQTASCSSLCSNTLSGSCDGKGYGATDGSTVATYIQSLGGESTCTSKVSDINVTNVVAQSSNPTASCTDPNNPVFFASGSAYPGTATNYVNGATSTNQTATDLQQYIVSQSAAVFGTNVPAVAVIGHLSTDTTLAATDPSTDYFNLAKAMGSSETFSVNAADYSPALTSISNFIVAKVQNSFVLSVPTGAQVVSVSVKTASSQTAVALASNMWSWTGSTLSISSSANLQPGDQVIYQCAMSTTPTANGLSAGL